MNIENIVNKGKEFGKSVLKTGAGALMFAAPYVSSGQDIVGNPNIEKASASGEGIESVNAHEIHGNVYYEVDIKGQRHNELWPKNTTAISVPVNSDDKKKAILDPGLVFERKVATMDGKDVSEAYLNDSCEFAVKAPKAGENDKRIASVGERDVNIGDLMEEFYTINIDGKQRIPHYMNKEDAEKLDIENPDMVANFLFTPGKENTRLKYYPEGTFSTQAEDQGRYTYYQVNPEESKQKYVDSIEDLTSPEGYPFDNNKYDIRRNTGQAVGFETGDLGRREGPGSGVGIHTQGKWAINGPYNGISGDLGIQIPLGNGFSVIPYVGSNGLNRSEEVSIQEQDLDNRIEGTNLYRDTRMNITRNLSSSARDFGRDVPANEFGAKLGYDGNGWRTTVGFGYGQRSIDEDVRYEVENTIKNDNNQIIQRDEIERTNEHDYNGSYLSGTWGVSITPGEWNDEPQPFWDNLSFGLEYELRVNSTNGNYNINKPTQAEFTNDGQLGGYDNPSHSAYITTTLNLFGGRE